MNLLSPPRYSVVLRTPSALDRGSQKVSEICLMAISLLFFVFLGLFKLFFDYFDKIMIMRNQKGRD